MIKIILPLLLLLTLVFACGENAPEEKPAPTPEVPAKSKAVNQEKNISLGEKLFLYCTACHSLKKGEAHKVGPNLHGFFGSKAATKEGFIYSDALKNSGIVWDDDSFRTWMKNPATYIPGTTMAFVGIEKEDHIDAIIEYLKEETK